MAPPGNAQRLLQPRIIYPWEFTAHTVPYDVARSAVIGKSGSFTPKAVSPASATRPGQPCASGVLVVTLMREKPEDILAYTVLQ